MALSIPLITRALDAGNLQFWLNNLITQINQQNVSGTTPQPFPP